MFRHYYDRKDRLRALHVNVGPDFTQASPAEPRLCACAPGRHGDPAGLEPVDEPVH